MLDGGGQTIEVASYIAWLAGEIFIVPFVLIARRLRYGYAFRRIRLTRGKFAIVDPDDYYRLAKYKWQAMKGTNTFYAGRTERLKPGRKQRCRLMHREIVSIPNGMLCDHINGNGLDNRKANLRPVTPAQNLWNTRKSKAKSRSRYKGVAWDRNDRRWEVRISVNSRRIYIGRFTDELEAAKAYDRAARKYHGRYAGVNFEAQGSTRRPVSPAN